MLTNSFFVLLLLSREFLWDKGEHMAYTFSESDIQTITSTLGVEPKQLERSWYFQLTNAQTKQSLALSIHNDVQLGAESNGSIITAQTHHGYFEIHDCTGFVLVEPDEVIFVSDQNGLVSSLVTGKSCTCSLFANIRADIITADFAKLDTSVLMAAMQLSLTESILQ